MFLSCMYCTPLHSLLTYSMTSLSLAPSPSASDVKSSPPGKLWGGVEWSVVGWGGVGWGGVEWSVVGWGGVGWGGVE